MDLEALCSIELNGTDEGAAAAGAEFVQGAAVVAGERLAGTLRYSQRLTRRSDGMAELTLHGALTTGDGALLILTASGRAGADGPGLLLISLHAQDERYRWVNTLILLGEGRFEGSHARGRIEVAAWRRG